MKTLPPLTEDDVLDDDPLERRLGLLRLVIGALFALSVAAATGTLGTVLIIAAVLLMIVLHEAGHLFAAKAAGMKVTEYFVGFGQRLWSVRKGETEYGVKAFVFLGGYCRIPGMTNLEEIPTEDEERTYRAQSFPRRIAVVLAGVGVQFVLAFVLFFVLHAVTGVVNYDKPLVQVGQVGPLETGPSPAQQAGLQAGDRILTIDGRRFERWDDIPPYIQARPGQTVNVEIERDGNRSVLAITPAAQEVANADTGERLTIGILGIRPEFAVDRTGPIAAVGRAGGEVRMNTGLVFSTLGRLFTFKGISNYAGQLRGSGPVEPSLDEPRFLSPIGLVRVAGVAADNGLRTVLYMLASINIFIGILNLVPLLPFDGGHAAVAIYERIRSRRGRRYQVDAAKLMPLTVAVVLVLAVLATTSIYLDIVRPVNF